jgi:hypothetical protein
MEMTEKQYADLVEKIGKDGAQLIDKKLGGAKGEIAEIVKNAIKGVYATPQEMEAAVNAALTEVKATLTRLEGIATKQGEDLNNIKDKTTSQKVGKTLEEVLTEVAPKVKALFNQGMGNIEIPLSQIALKTAGLVSIGNTIQPMTPPPNSPYLPGIGNSLELFEIINNPNFAVNFVDMGRTNLAFLPWANQTTTEGGATAVQEGALKPLWNPRFKVEMSEAKKIAAMATITEEFDQDLPGFTTLVKRLLMDEVMRKFDDAIYAAVIAVAPGFSITGLNGQIDDANLWDAIGAGLAQVSKNNYVANFIGLNPITMWRVWMTKTAVERQYQSPPFLGKIMDKLAESNKVAENYALIGDLNQYKVDIYKEPMLKVGWNNDDFQRNQFSVVAEIRYHNYISDIRKVGLVYYNLNTIRSQIDSGS